MVKKLTLNETWKQCLAMWKWIAEQIKQGSGSKSWILKAKWMREHPRFGNQRHNCFFCEYSYRQIEELCSHCPGKLVSKKFECERYLTYHWIDKPLAFYRKLLDLNKKRKSKQQAVAGFIMKKKKVHYAKAIRGYWDTAACNAVSWLGADLSKTKRKVTCKRCRKTKAFKEK